MRILLDENLPVDLAAEIAGHQVDTVVGLGWAGVKNGELLERARQRYSALLTMDRNIAFQQNMSVLPFGVLLLRAPTNQLRHLRPLVPMILENLKTLLPGELREVGA